MFKMVLSEVDYNNHEKGNNIEEINFPILLNDCISEVLVKIDLALNENDIIEIENHHMFGQLSVISACIENISVYIHNIREEEDIINYIKSYRNGLENLESIDSILSYFSLLNEKIIKIKNNNIGFNGVKEKDFEVIDDILNYINEKALDYFKEYETKYNYINLNKKYLLDCLIKPSEILSKKNEKYNIVFDIDEKGENDFFIDVNFINIDKDLFLPKIIIKLIRNLVFNAKKYSNLGSCIRLSITENKNDYNIKVIDQGKGIRDENINNIFKYGFRGGEVGDRSGTGFGLTEVYHIVDNLGGDIKLKTKWGVGTCFDITIPYKKEVA